MEVQTGEVLALIGPSGSGKTTFLRCLNGLEHFDSGSIDIQNRSFSAGQHANSEALRQLRISLGMVFQQFQLFPHLSVLGNIVEAPVQVLGQSRTDAEKDAMVLLERMNLQQKAMARPRELSGGQQQRVAIARALAMKPSGLLFDEPTSALDPRMTGEIASIVRNLAKEGLAILVVTHDMKFARTVADRIAVFHQGTIAEEGSPELLFESPKSQALKDLLSGF